MTDVVPHLDIPGLCHEDLADFAGVGVFDSSDGRPTAARLRTDLHDPLVRASRLDHQAAFANVVRGGLLDIDILAGVAAKNGGRSVPMIGSRDHDCVDFGVIEEMPHVVRFFRLLRARLGHFRLSPLKRCLVGVAEMHDVSVFYAQVGASEAASSPTYTDHSQIDFVICRDRLACRCAGECGANEVSPVHKAPLLPFCSCCRNHSLQPADIVDRMALEYQTTTSRKRQSALPAQSNPRVVSP